jgi:hypothetical protein
MSIISGVAIDSLNGGHLKGALVSVSGTTRTSVTDSLGRFQIDSIPEGSRFLEVQHGLLDTLGIAVVTPRFDFVAGKPFVGVVAVPSAETVIGRKCSAQERTAGPGALLGMVSYPTARTPAAGATVVLTWVDIDVDDRSLTKVERRSVATVETSGRFRIFGLPSDFSANLMAVNGADSTAVIGVSFNPRLAIATLLLPRRGENRVTTLRGRVLDSRGSPVASVRITVDNADAVTTGPDGNFVIAGVPPGTRVLSARKIGFEPVEQVLQITGQPETISVRMDNPVQVLATVRVTALSQIGLTRVGFLDRQKNAKGRFFDPERIAIQRPFRIADLIAGLPWVKDAQNPRVRGTRMVSPRNKHECIEYVVDGRPWLIRAPYQGNRNDTTVIGGADRGTPNDWIMGVELAAVEAYEAGRVPSEIKTMTTHAGTCHTFVVWTKWKLEIR